MKSQNFSKISTFEPKVIRACVITSARNSALMIARKNKSDNTIDIERLFSIRDTEADDEINRIIDLEDAVLANDSTTIITVSGELISLIEERNRKIRISN